MTWLTLILSMPTENATARMRAWRALKSSGAAVLRDGVYLLPSSDRTRETLNAIAHAVQESSGTAYLADTAFPDDDSARLTALFDRSADYAELMKSIEPIQAALSPDTAMDALKQLRKFRKVYAQLSDIDFFPGRPGARQTPLCLSWKRAPIARSLRTNRMRLTAPSSGCLSATIKGGPGRHAHVPGWIDWLAPG